MRILVRNAWMCRKSDLNRTASGGPTSEPQAGYGSLTASAAS